VAVSAIGPAAVSARIANVVEVKIEGRQYLPAYVNAHAGDTLKICNTGQIYNAPFSFSRYSPWGSTPRASYPHLGPGQCEPLTLQNPTGKPVEVRIGDEIHTNTWLFVTVYPIGATLPAAKPTQPLTTVPPPTKLTLTVNTTTAVATTTANSVHVTAHKVAPDSYLEIKATLDEPLPVGWTMVVFHNGDQKSYGNGQYYELCNLKGHSVPDTPSSINGTPTHLDAPDECAENRKTLPSPGDDFVGAQVRSPTGFSLYIQIYVPVR
jgi:hypothetical protein